MKILQKIYDWLSNTDPTGKIKAHKAKQKERLFDDASPDFLLWAFGPNYASFDMNNKMIAWNQLHADKLIIEQVDHMHDSLITMGQLWVLSEKGK
jgi:hypothetical protein